MRLQAALGKTWAALPQAKHFTVMAITARPARAAKVEHRLPSLGSPPWHRRVARPASPDPGGHLFLAHKQGPAPLARSARPLVVIIRVLKNDDRPLAVEHAAVCLRRGRATAGACRAAWSSPCRRGIHHSGHSLRSALCQERHSQLYSITSSTRNSTNDSATVSPSALRA